MKTVHVQLLMSAFLRRRGILRFPEAARRGWPIIGVLLVFSCISATAFAQTASKPVTSTAIQRGEATFRRSCAGCHGQQGNGKGPAAPALTPRPK
jgi:mono/diheme cytochrome c family protein